MSEKRDYPGTKCFCFCFPIIIFHAWCPFVVLTNHSRDQLFLIEFFVAPENISKHIRSCTSCCQSLEFDFLCVGLWQAPKSMSDRCVTWDFVLCNNVKNKKQWKATMCLFSLGLHEMKLSTHRHRDISTGSYYCCLRTGFLGDPW